MLQAIWAAASGMNVQSSRLGVLADDISNLDTAGFKAVNAEPLASNRSMVFGTAVPAGVLAHATGVVLGPSWRSWSEGPITETGRPLDLAVDGRGFFRVVTPGGAVGLTRAGAFSPDANGDLVNASGDRVLGVNGRPIRLPAGGGSIDVTAGGVITVTHSRGAPQAVGQLSLALPTQPDGLIGGPGGVWLPAAGAGNIQVGVPGSANLGSIRQGALEASNVDVANVTVSMVLAERAYTLNARAVQASSQMWSEANQLLA